MKFKLKTGGLLIFLLFSLTTASFCWAGFGVSPPKVENDHLLPGSYYEKVIHLSRGNPNSDLMAEVEYKFFDESVEWVSIKEGERFPLPKGENSVPMTVQVDVPSDASLGNYTGQIKVSAVPADKADESGVSVVLAAAINFDIEVTDQEVEGMIMRGVRVKKAVEGRPIEFAMRIENTGNVATRPDKVKFEVFDRYHDKVIATTETSEMDSVPAFETKEIVAELPANLEINEYQGDFEIFKGGKTLREGTLIFKVKERQPTFWEKAMAFVLENKEYIVLGASLLVLVVFVWFKVIKNGVKINIEIGGSKKE